MKHEAVLHQMEKYMNGFVNGLSNLKEQFFRFRCAQLQNDRRKRLSCKIDDKPPIREY